MSNRLAHETSPYLLQHADNPVDWYPWGPEALDRAREEDIPIFLSIGYSACHWCHVMERESFENPDTAALMNQLFVNIKVDREERPDVDEIYMRAVQALTGHGGWPMSMFLTPDGRPFFGGTYFPPGPRHGMPAFRQVLQHAAHLYRTQPDNVHRMTQRMLELLEQGGRLPAPEAALQGDWLARLVTAATPGFDTVDGGFGHAPKFPPHGTIAALLAHHHRTGDGPALKMATHTLDAMAKGGMYDLLGGGFARYSVDDEWRIPHFEKMLYDNGQLIPLYVDAHLITGSPHYARVVTESIGWLMREMRLDHGGFAAAQDADSEGEEGKFFCWTPRQLRDVLGIVDGTRLATLLQVTDTGSFEHGTSVLRLDQPLETLPETDQALVTAALPQLMAIRSQRIAPARDDKVVTAWNALVIGALARASTALQVPAWADEAAVTARFLLDEVTLEGRLMRTHKDGRSHLLGYADDHVMLISALIDLYQATFDVQWLNAANALADSTVELFWDDDAGGLFYTGKDAEALVTRSKNMIGGAEPSANGTAAHAFARLATLCGRDDLGELADLILRCYQPLLEPAAHALGVEALAAAWRTGRVDEVGIVGNPDAPETQAMVAAARAQHLPFAVISQLDPGHDTALVPWMASRTDVAEPTGFLCHRGTCQLPVTDPQKWAEHLASLSPGL